MTKGNRGYVHAGCEFNVSEVLKTDDPLTAPFDVLRALRKTEETGDPTRRMRRKRGTKYRPLMEYLDACDRHTVTLTFAEIEEIIGDSLPASARNPRSTFWHAKTRALTIADAWEVANWILVEVEYDRERIKLVDDLPDHVWAYMPRELTERRIPVDAAHELTRYHDHIIGKYDLGMAR